MPERKSALPNGKMTARRFLLFLVPFLLFCRVQCWPRGLFLGLRVQILLRWLLWGSPRPPFPHERGWKHRFSLLPRSGGTDAPGRGRADGPGVRRTRGRPARSCGFGLFPSRRLRGFFPHGTQGRFVQFSVRFSAAGEGKAGRRDKEKAATVVTGKGKGLRWLALALPPIFFFFPYKL